MAIYNDHTLKDNFSLWSSSVPANKLILGLKPMRPLEDHPKEHTPNSHSGNACNDHSRDRNRSDYVTRASHCFADYFLNSFNYSFHQFRHVYSPAVDMVKYQTAEHKRLNVPNVPATGCGRASTGCIVYTRTGRANAVSIRICELLAPD